MNGIMGMAKLLADTKLSPEQRTYVGAVSTSASALLALIEDLLDYSKIEAGRFDAEPQPMSPREIADNVVELLAAQAPSPRASASAAMSRPTCRRSITADPGRRAPGAAQPDRQRRSSSPTPAACWSTCRMVGTGDKAGTIRFSVSRHRTGHSGPRTLDRIFEEFEQADGTSTRTHGGAGLGLAISKRHRRLDGRHDRRVDSEPGKGSDFAFEIPGRRRHRGPQPRRPALAGRSVVILSKNCRRGRGDRPHHPRAWRHGRHRRHGRPGRRAMPTAATPCWSMRRWKRPTDGCSSGCARRGFAGAEAITLIAPTDRGMLGEFRASGYRDLPGPPGARRDAAPGAAGRRWQPVVEPPAPAGQARRPTRRAPAAACRAVDPARRGQRHQRHAGAGDAAQGRPPRRARRQRQGRGRGRDRRRPQAPLRRGAHGPAYAGYGRARRHRRHPPLRGGGRRARPCRSWCCRPTARKRPGTRCWRMAPAASSPSRSIPKRWCARSRSAPPPDLPRYLAKPAAILRAGELLPGRADHGTVTILLHCPLIPRHGGMARRRITRACSLAGA